MLAYILCSKDLHGCHLCTGDLHIVSLCKGDLRYCVMAKDGSQLIRSMAMALPFASEAVEVSITESDVIFIVSPLVPSMQVTSPHCCWSS